MAKDCLKGDCTNPRFGKGYCKWHQYLRTDKKPNKKKSLSKRIKPVSDNRLEQLARYRSERDKYMKAHPKCEYEGCGDDSTELHHKGGRNGERVYHVPWFMACCHDCHIIKIHLHPADARKKGYLI